MLSRIDLSRWPLFLGASIAAGLASGALAGSAELGLLALALVVFAVVAALALRHLDLAVVLVVFTVFTQSSDIVLRQTGFRLLSELLVVLLLGSYLVNRRSLAELPSAVKKAAVLFGVYGVVILVSALWATNVERTFALFGVYLRHVLVALVVVLAVRTFRTLRRAVWAVIAGGLFLGALGTYQYLTSSFESDFLGYSSAAFQNILGSTDDFRIGGPFEEPNYYAQLLVVVVPLALDRLANERDLRLRLVAAAAALVSALTVIFTFSRGGFLALVVVCGIYVVSRVRRPGVLAAGLLVAGVLVLAAPNNYFERVTTIGDALAGTGDEAGDDLSFRGRTSEAVVGYRMFRESPLLGVGAANYATLYQDYASDVGIERRRQPREPHSLYLGVAAETGLVGLVAFGAIIVSAFTGIGAAARALRGRRRDDQASMVLALRLGLVGYLTAALFLHLAFDRIFWVLLGLALAVPALVERPRPHGGAGTELAERASARPG